MESKLNSVPDLAVTPTSETTTPEILKQSEGIEHKNVDNKMDVVDNPNDGNNLEDNNDVVSEEPGKKSFYVNRCLYTWLANKCTPFLCHLFVRSTANQTHEERTSNYNTRWQKKLALILQPGECI